ncbi:MAG: Dyp-type peroxidase [Arachnia sp.]
MSPRVARRDLFGYTSAAGIAAAAGIVSGRLTKAGATAQEAAAVSRQSYSAYGEHQSGITTPAPAAGKIVAFDLLDGVDQAALGRFMRVWTSSIVALMEGHPTPGDAAPDLAHEAVSMSVAVGFGPAVFEIPGLAGSRPSGFMDIPPMDHDELAERWCGGDIVAFVSADDDTSIDYAVRRLTVDAKPFATPRWVQSGSWRGVDAQGNAVTGRNLFGQVDGTGNPSGDTLAEALWSTDGWFTGGTQMVIRRIEMDLDVWDTLIRDKQEKSVGRRLDTGAPLTGEAETDAMDLSATHDGELVIPADAHARVSHPSQNSGRTMLRRGLNYTHTDNAGATTSGLLFVSFQASLADQFIPVQTKLDHSDALNEWTTAIGSAVFAILPGFDADGHLGDGVLGG